MSGDRSAVGRRRIGRRAGFALAALVGLGLVVEGGARLAGVIDVPAYVLDPEVGYFPQPNQTGRFLNRNRWAFNDRSMGVARPWQPSDKNDVLLIGNSVIAGGNPFDQSVRVGVLLEQSLGSRYAIWPIATGGWNMVNEERYLAKQPDVVAAANFFIWEFLGDDFKGAAAWPGDTQFPLGPPRFAVMYEFRKFILERVEGVSHPYPPREATPQENFQAIDAMIGRLCAATRRNPGGILFLYPDRAAVEDLRRGATWPRNRARIEALAAAHQLMIVDLSRDSRWTVDLYRDGVHPTEAGNRLIAKVLAAATAAAMARGEAH